ncbi:MAG: class I SAM-dependent methyltransferase [Chlamydiae bacterium]|nr:class I SAM-dependent methyltransferase [Chlamydiota bacterium]MBI3277104.1 class I SAM-dependent methyltransferase [Chlamydiota bacterium]
MKYPVLKNRMDAIRPLIQEKSVLDLGCVDHDLKQLKGTWLHRELIQSARKVLGVDSLPEAVQKLKEMGFNTVCQNVEELDLHEKFDVAIAGEIIEHLNNPGRFLSAIHRHLQDQGQLILTTPNPFSIAQFFKIIKHHQIKVNTEHTTWFDPQTLQVLLKNHHFKVQKIYWLHDFKRFYWRSLFARLRPYFHDGFLIIAEKGIISS